MKSKAVFLDRDGTVNIDRNYLYKIEDFEFEKNAAEGLIYLYNCGYKLIIISNQSGIARGYFTEDDVRKLHEHINEECRKLGFEITEFYICPHYPVEKTGEYSLICGCRKPGTELIERAVTDHDIDIGRSFMIGDKESDITAGKKAGLKTILVGTGYGSETVKTFSGYDHFINDLSEISKIVK